MQLYLVAPKRVVLFGWNLLSMDFLNSIYSLSELELIQDRSIFSENQTKTIVRNYD